MTADNLILITREGWWQVRDGVVSEVPAWLTLEGSSMVVTDFDESTTGAYRFDGGKTAYAVPMIEKRARNEGLVEGGAHIVVHQLLAIHGGFQTIHTVVPLDFWQRLQQWSSQQKDHCLLIPMGSLLCSGVKVGQARIVVLERSLHFFAHTPAGLVHASANAIGNSPEDFQSAVRVLANLTRAELNRGLDGEVEWIPVLTALDTNEEALQAWNEAAPVAARCQPLSTLTAEKGAQVSALMWMLPKVSLAASVNPRMDKLAWWSESLVAPVASVVILAAVGLMGLGLYAHTEAKSAQQTRVTQLQDLSTLEARIQAANSVVPPSGFAPVADFAQKLGDGAIFDPLPMLATLKQAAGKDILIQRIRLETQDRDRSFRVDGIAGTGGIEPISRFLNVLRDAGWQARAVEPADSSNGAFSYRLTASPLSRN